MLDAPRFDAPRGRTVTQTRKVYDRMDWLRAAKTMLVNSGIDGVKVDLIARKMRITRGSFYWHFKSRQDLLDELLADWRQRNMDGVSGLIERSESGSPSFVDCIRFWISQEDDVFTFDMAMRVWGRQSPSVAQVINEVDDAWINLLTSMFRVRGFDDERSFARARIVYFHQMGYYTLYLRESIEQRVAMIPLYSEILFGEVNTGELEPLMQELLSSKAALSSPKTHPTEQD